MEISIKDLHLAAYVKSNGAKLVGCDHGIFVFESDKTEVQWRILHSNSCCRRVDTELLNLRQFLNKG